MKRRGEVKTEGGGREKQPTTYGPNMIDGGGGEGEVAVVVQMYGIDCACVVFSIA